jgi:POT family proton-dependent oligopeptide transporter
MYMNEVAPESYWANIDPVDRPPAGATVNLVSTELFQSINPFFIIIFTPLVVGVFAWLRARKLEPSTPAKIAWGLVITAASTAVMIAAVLATHGGTMKGSMWWLVGTYGVVTIGELFLSPMGLSLVSKLAPGRVTALMMGGWFLSTSIGNKLAGVIGGLWERLDLVWIFTINGVCALAAAGMIAVLVPWIRRVMHEHEQQMLARREKAAPTEAMEEPPGSP